MRSSSAWYTGGAYTIRSKLLATLRPPHLEAFSCTEGDGLLPALSNGTSLTDEHIPPPKPSTQRPSTRRNTHTHTTEKREESRERGGRQNTSKEEETNAERREEKRRADRHRDPSDQGG
jgi:hypothetical protein